MMMSDSVILKNNISDERRMISVTWEVSASSHHQMLQCFMSQNVSAPVGPLQHSIKARAAAGSASCSLPSLSLRNEVSTTSLQLSGWDQVLSRCRVPLVLGLCSPLGNWVEGWEEMGSQ